MRWAIYLALLILRFLGVVQRGYIHPDEFYQGGAELFFGRHQEGDGTHQADGGGAERHLAKSVPWEFEPRHAVRSIVPPAFMTLLPLRAYVAARSLMGKILCNPRPSPSRLCDALSVEASERQDDDAKQDSPLSFLWAPAMETLSGREVWLVPRLFMALMSVIFLDGSLWMMLSYDRLRTHTRGNRKSSLHEIAPVDHALTSVARDAYKYGPPFKAIVLASSWPCLVFGVRPFTNNLEAMALVFLLMIANVGASSGGIILLLLVGATCAVGIFVRFTFAFFAFPVVLIFLWNRCEKVECRLGGFLSDGLWMTLSFLIVSSAFVWVDARYYSWQASLACGDSSCAETPSGIQNALKYVAPLNAFRYNSKSANLAEHGLHPRITHAAVNVPMLFGPLAFAMYSSIAIQSKWCGGLSLSMACQMSMLAGLLVLSCAPHQEPRFLLPILVPLALLYGHKVVGSGESQKDSQKLILVLRIVWVVFNVILYAFFGWLHQGGLVPSLLYLPKIHAGEAVIFWKAYMPPTFLTQKESFERGDAVCGASEGEATCTNRREGVILDLQGADSSVLLEVLRERLPCPQPEEATVGGNGIRLLSPISVILPLVGDTAEMAWDGYSFTPTQSFRGHISTEDWPAFDGLVTKFIDQLKLAVYEVSCTGN
ncbi:hypothetical protein ACHAXT_008344 [Thalassiosira profunda]